MSDRLPHRHRVLAIILLSSLLSFSGVRIARAQTPKTTSQQASQADAQKLRAEADHDFEGQNYTAALAKYLRVYPSYSKDFEINYRIGWIYINSPRPEIQKSIPYLRLAHQLQPANVAALHDLAKMTSFARQFNESLPLYRDLLQVAPSVPEYRLEYARVLSWAERTAQAISEYNTYLTQVPSNFPARIELGRLLSEQKDFPGAMEQYNYVLRFQPGNVPARTGLAQVLAWTGQLQPSLEEIEKVLKTNPDDFDARLVKAYDLLWSDELDQAEKLFKELAKENPKNTDVQDGLRAIADRRKAKAAGPAAPSGPVAAPTDLEQAEQSESQGRYSEAIAHYRDYLAKSPNDSDAQFRLARVLGWNKEYTASETMLQTWVAQHPNSYEGYFLLARVLSWDEKYPESSEQFRKGLALRPQDVAARVERARTLSWTREYDQALEEYQRALSLQPDNAEARRGIVRTEIWKGDIAAARQALNELRQTLPDDPQIKTLQEELSTAETQRARAEGGAAPGVEEYFRGILQKDPQNVQAHLELADLYAGRRDFPPAIKELRAASELKPDDDALRLRLARVLSWNQQYPESASLYREHLAKHPDDSESQLQLARILSWSRDYNASVAAYEDFLKKNPNRNDIRLELARVLGWAKEYHQAIEKYDALLSQEPKNYDALLGEGRIYSYQSRWRKSLNAYDAALALRPADRQALTGKAQVLIWSGQPAAARDLLTQLHADNPKDATVLISMASAENSLRRPDRALELLDQAEAVEPKNPDIQTVREQIQAGLRPELNLGWSYLRDTESLNIWRYQVLDFRFNLHPLIRNFVTVDVLPASARADIFGYPVFTETETIYSPRVPTDPLVPAPTLLTADDFPAQGLLVPGSARIRQQAVQFQAGGIVQASRWLSFTAGAGAIMLRHGSPDLDSYGLPSTRTRLIYTVSPTFHLGRYVEISLGASRQYWAYTPKSISQEIHVDEQTATLTLAPDSRSRIVLGGYHREVRPGFEIPDLPIFNADFTEILDTFPGRSYRMHGNGATLTATRSVAKMENAELIVGYDAMVFGYTHPAGLPSADYFVNTGVFTPGFYQRHAALVRVITKPWRHLNWDVHGTAGVQQIRQHSDLSFSSTAGTRLDFILSPHATFSLGYDYFNTASAFQALVRPGRAAAYHSNNVTAGLHFRF